MSIMLFLSSRLNRARQTFMLGNRTHAIFLVLLVDEKAWEVFDWTAWSTLYREKMSLAAKKVIVAENNGGGL